MPPGEQTAEDYHKRFHSLISLTALVSNINHDDGQLTKEVQLNMCFDKCNLPTCDLVLNAIAAIFMCDNKAMATIYQDPKPDAVFKTNSPATYKIYAMQNTPCVWEDQLLSSFALNKFICFLYQAV
jgi:hypothetical protein